MIVPTRISSGLAPRARMSKLIYCDGSRRTRKITAFRGGELGAGCRQKQKDGGCYPKLEEQVMLTTSGRPRWRHCASRRPVPNGLLCHLTAIHSL